MAFAYPKILYFINGPVPTDEQLRDAQVTCGPGVCFRNATFANSNKVEQCDGVAGPAIPQNYADAFPNIEDTEAVAQRLAERNPIKAPPAPDTRPRPYRKPPAEGWETDPAKASEDEGEHDDEGDEHDEGDEQSDDSQGATKKRKPRKKK